MRYVYLDNLRAILMLMGLVLHSCAAFSVSGYWLVTYIEPLTWADTVNQLIHWFRMPLFFIISGFFGAYLLLKYSIMQFLKNKMMRIGLPLITAILVFNTLQAGMLSVVNNQPFAQTYQQIGSGHLWFLINLLLYFFILGCLRPIINSLTERSFQSYLAIILPVSLIGFPVIYLGLLALNKIGLDIYAPIIGGTSVFVLFSYFDYFMLGVIFGYLGHDVCWRYLNQHRYRVLSFVLFVIIALVLINHIKDVFADVPVVIEITSTLQERWLVVATSMVILWLAKHLLQTTHPISMWLFSTSYTVYLSHHFFVLSLIITCNQLYLSGIKLPATVAFVLVLTLTWTFSIGVHKCITHKQTLRILFNGKP